MGVIPGPLVTGPEPLRRRYGLFTAAVGPIDLPEPHGRGGGVRYVPRSCGTARPFPIACAAEEVGTVNKTLDSLPGIVHALPFGVAATLECGAVGFTDNEFRTLVQERLSDGEQGAVELAFWTGEGEAAEDLEIDSLAGTADDITAGDDGSITTVVSDLEDWLYRLQGYGNAGFIHAPVSVAAYAAEAHLVIDDGRVKRTPYGSVWVFGGGYPGTGAAGTPAPDGGAFLHITGQVAIWRAPEPWVHPVQEGFDRTTNGQSLLAEREYAVGVDCHNARTTFNPLGAS